MKIIKVTARVNIVERKDFDPRFNKIVKLTNQNTKITRFVIMTSILSLLLIFQLKNDHIKIILKIIGELIFEFLTYNN